MKEKLEGKIAAIVDFILKKPENKITMDDYNILAAELRDIRLREQQADSGKRLSEMIALMNTGISAG